MIVPGAFLCRSCLYEIHFLPPYERLASLFDPVGRLVEAGADRHRRAFQADDACPLEHGSLVWPETLDLLLDQLPDVFRYP